LAITGAQGRAKGFQQVVANYRRRKGGRRAARRLGRHQGRAHLGSLLTKYPDIAGGFFHNDDMALAAHNVMKAKGREGIVIAGVDAMPPAVAAVLEGTMLATVRNPSCRIHGWAVAAGVAAVVGGEKTGEGGIPNFILADGPVITKETAPGISGCRRTSSSDRPKVG
jgi:ribose transport system substrate-binding protein